jgi:hypothetical protein
LVIHILQKTLLPHVDNCWELMGGFWPSGVAANWRGNSGSWPSSSGFYPLPYSTLTRACPRTLSNSR